jgi:hypothetical protein
LQLLISFHTKGEFVEHSFSLYLPIFEDSSTIQHKNRRNLLKAVSLWESRHYPTRRLTNVGRGCNVLTIPKIFAGFYLRPGVSKVFAGHSEEFATTVLIWKIIVVHLPQPAYTPKRIYANTPRHSKLQLSLHRFFFSRVQLDNNLLRTVAHSICPPDKLSVCDACGTSTGTPGVVRNCPLIETGIGALTNVDEAVVSANPDTAFRWDAAAMQWSFNTSTKCQTRNVTYVYRSSLDDGSTFDIQFGLE